MKWYHYLAAFSAGFFLANVVPHFVNGVSGNQFPSPFGDPPGVGLSSPTTNVIWGLINLVIGYLLFRAGKVSSSSIVTIILLFLGITVCALMCSAAFAR